MQYTKAITILTLHIFLLICSTVSANDQLSRDTVAPDLTYEQATGMYTDNDSTLYKTILSSPSCEWQKKENIAIAYCYRPVVGYFHQVAYDSLQTIVKHILSAYGQVSFTDKHIVTKHLQEKITLPYDLLLIPLEVLHHTSEAIGVGNWVTAALDLGHINQEKIRFLIIDLQNNCVCSDFTIKKTSGWFARTKRGSTDYSDLSRLANRIGFDAYAKKGIYKLNENIKGFFKRKKRK